MNINLKMQTKNSLDKETLIKIGKGAAIAAGGAGALYLLNAIGTIEINNPLFASFVAWFVPVAINAIKEYIKGENI